MTAVRRLLSQMRTQRRIPPHVVGYVRQRVGQSWRQVRRRTRALLPDRRYIAARRALAAAAPNGRASVVRVDGVWQVAIDYRFAAVRQVAEDNLTTVSRLLARARIPFFVRDASSPGPITVGVADEHRAEVVRVLAGAAPHEHLYARDARGGRPVALRHARRATRAISRADRVLVYRNHHLTDDYVIGISHACTIEFWQRAGANLRAPTGAVPGQLVRTEVTSAKTVIGQRRYPTLSAFADHHAMAADAPFPVDVVYTWVDDSDPRWRRRLAEERSELDGQPLHDQAANASQYRNRDELRYSLRSLAMYADFVRRVYLVTDGQVPDWLDIDHPDVRIVDHTEILQTEWLPTFNSHAIESRLHHIDGLAEHYLYLNDDFLFGRQVAPTTFFTANGLAKVFVDERAPIPAGPPSLEDLPVNSAAKNVRDLIHEHFGMGVGRKMLHVPYPQRRSVLEEMEKRFPDEFRRTANSRFRRPTDVSIASCFSHYYAFATGRAVPAEIPAEYVNVASRWAPLQMRRLLADRDRDAICLNETDVPPDHMDGIDDMVTRFLRSYLPVPSAFERPARPHRMWDRDHRAMLEKP